MESWVGVLPFDQDASGLNGRQAIECLRQLRLPVAADAGDTQNLSCLQGQAGVVYRKGTVRAFHRQALQPEASLRRGIACWRAGFDDPLAHHELGQLLRIQ